MPDRRQGDRRESSGFENKKITISLPVFILSFTICLLVLICVILCTYFSNISYEKGYNEGYDDCYRSIYGNYENEDNEYFYEYYGADEESTTPDYEITTSNVAE